VVRGVSDASQAMAHGMEALFSLVTHTRTEADATLEDAGRSKSAIAEMAARTAELRAAVASLMRDVQAA
jgi:type II secretory pathway component PulJ